MSNLVGMWAFIMDIPESDTIKMTVFIQGKVDDDHFIVQAISALDGSPNIARIVKVEHMYDWVFLPDKATADYVFEDYCRHKRLRFKFDRKIFDKT